MLYTNAIFDQFVPVIPSSSIQTGIDSLVAQGIRAEASLKEGLSKLEKSPTNAQDNQFCDMLENKVGTLIFLGMSDFSLLFLLVCFVCLFVLFVCLICPFFFFPISPRQCSTICCIHLWRFVLVPSL